MSIAFNSGGLITRGMGEDHRLVTRGMGGRFDFGGIYKPRKKEVSCFLNLIVPIIKENSQELSIFSPLELRKSSSLGVHLGIKKDVLEVIDMVAGIDSGQLMDILEEI